jgi:hypothetical protein
MLRAQALAALSRVTPADAAVSAARHASAARRDWSTAVGPDPDPAAGPSPSPPDDDSVSTLLRRLGVAKTLTRRSAADRAGLLDLLEAGVRHLRAYLSVSLTKKAIEKGFEGPAFLEGALGAYHAVHAAAAAQDWDALRAMTTPAITEAAQRLTAAAAAEGLAVSLEVEGSVQAEIDTMFLMSPGLVDRTAAGWTEDDDEGEAEVVQAFMDRAPSSDTTTANDSGSSHRQVPWSPELVGRHQGLYVRFSGGAVILRLAAGRGAAATAAAAGLAAPPDPDSSTVLEVTDRRVRTWVFERGPLPSGLPVRDTQLAWRVLAIDPS